ncbi:MAG TPA: hypothetical protein V6C88_17390 [Chroococcidiopsis sp.]
MINRSEFLAPQARYHGQVKPENLVFNANLQEFSSRVGILSALYSNGKLSPDDCYQQIKTLWLELEHSKTGLGIGDNPFQSGGNK